MVTGNFAIVLGNRRLSCKATITETLDNLPCTGGGRPHTKMCTEPAVFEILLDYRSASAVARKNLPALVWQNHHGVDDLHRPAGTDHELRDWTDGKPL
jgi:hypothetical protein